MGIAPAELPPTRREELAGFIAHYERISRHMLAGGVRADATAFLAEDRTVARLTPRRPFTPGS
jgi:D-glycerate 3-kinase